MNKKVILIILDGYGHSDVKEHNAIYLAKKPNIEAMEKNNPKSLIKTSGEAVGLPPGVMGNSEVGHLNIGSGRIIKQEFTKISDFAKENGFEKLKDIKRVLTSQTGNLHIMGLLSDGGVHSHLEHIFLILEAAQRLKSKKKIFIHAFTDGRDTPPKSALEFIAQLEAAIKKTGQGQIATVGGRFYMMDRDKRWERVQIAYDILTREQRSTFAHSAEEIIRESYKQNINDEFIVPRQVQGMSPMAAEDSVVFINFRADRARELSQALAGKSFSEFETPIKIKEENYVTFTQYDGAFSFPVLFLPERYKNLLGEIVSSHGGSQLRIAETEKYAHVTYFFNGGIEEPFLNEERVLVPSPKEVKTYDLKPEMSALTLTEELLKRVAKKPYDFIVLNFANGDMVGHTGVETASIKAIETLDLCLGRIQKELLPQGYDILITADHGNSECLVDPVTHQPHTAHTTNPVPLIWVSGTSQGKKLKDGILADIAPTILEIFGWPKPAEMTGHSLIVN